MKTLILKLQMWEPLTVVTNQVASNQTRLTTGKIASMDLKMLTHSSIIIIIMVK